jgi:hypothetical protein
VEADGRLLAGDPGDFEGLGKTALDESSVVGESNLFGGARDALDRRGR